MFNYFVYDGLLCHTLTCESFRPFSVRSNDEVMKIVFGFAANAPGEFRLQVREKMGGAIVAP